MTQHRARSIAWLDSCWFSKTKSGWILIERYTDKTYTYSMIRLSRLRTMTEEEYGYWLPSKR